jgi:hypothetical protein
MSNPLDQQPGEAGELPQLPPLPRIEPVPPLREAIIPDNPGAPQPLLAAPHPLVPPAMDPPIRLAWDDLVRRLDPKEYEVATVWLEQTAHVSMEDAAKPMAALDSVLATDPFNADFFMNQVVMATTPMHLLVNIGDQVQVIYGARQCCLVPGGGRRILALMGERVLSVHGFRQPDLKALPGTLIQQVDHFGKVTTAALTLDEILAQHAANPDGPGFVLPPILAENREPVSTLRAFPIPQKFAGLFLRGMSLKEAAQLISDLLHALPAESRAGLKQLVNFIRVACSKAVQTNWQHRDTADPNELYDWWQGLLTQQAPQRSAESGVRQQQALMLPAAENPDSEISYLRTVVTGLTRGPLLGPEVQNPARKRYTDLHKQKFAEWTNIEELSEFYTEMEEYRGKPGDSRVFIEHKLAVPQQDDRDLAFAGKVFFDAKAITTIKDMDLAGSEEMTEWSGRRDGFTIFLTSPPALQHRAGGQERRDACMRYEQTMGQHTPEDVRKMDSLTTTDELLPASPERAKAWVASYIRISRKMIGPGFLLLPALYRILHTMDDHRAWLPYRTKAQIMTLAWNIHVGIKEGLTDRSPHLLEEVLTLLRGRRLPDFSALPVGVQEIICTGTGPRLPLAGKRKQDDDGGPVAVRQKREQAQNPGPDYSRQWASDLARAAAALRPDVLTGRRFLHDPQKLKELYGTEFLKLFPGDRTPCMLHFIFGKCFSQCNRCHTTTARPSPSVLAGIKSRVKARCDEIVAEAQAGKNE